MDLYFIKRDSSVGIQEILYLKANENYTFFYLSDGSKKLSSTTLKKHQDRLVPTQFIRVNRGTVVNRRHISKIVTTQDETFLLLSSGQKIKVSRRRRDTLDFLAS